MSRSDKSLILGHCKKLIKILQHSVLWIAFGEITKDLCCYRSVMVIFIHFNFGERGGLYPSVEHTFYDVKIAAFDFSLLSSQSIHNRIL